MNPYYNKKMTIKKDDLSDCPKVITLRISPEFYRDLKRAKELLRCKSSSHALKKCFSIGYSAIFEEHH